MRIALASAVALTLNAASASAQIAEKTLASALAAEAAQAALAHCVQQGHKVSVTVVDRSGRIKAQLRGDDARPHTLESSRRKAYTALTMRNSTAALAEALKSTPGNAPLFTLPDLLPLAGGLPIKADDEVIGGIGVGGAPGGNLDEACAAAGIEAIKARL